MVKLEEVAEKILKYRTKNKLSQKEAAIRIGISNKTLCHIENKDRIDYRKTTLMSILYKLEELENK